MSMWPAIFRSNNQTKETVAMSTSVPSVGSPFSHLARNPSTKGKGDVPPNTPDDDEDQDEAADDDDDEETGDGKPKKSKKAKKLEDDADKKDEDEPGARAARAREKGRLRAIMSSAAGLKFPSAALEVALGTSVPRNAAIQMLKAMTKDASPARASGSSLRDRMAGVHVPDIGGGGDARPAANLAEQIILAGKKARGETT
jgi:hypothetical protein